MKRRDAMLLASLSGGAAALLVATSVGAGSILHSVSVGTPDACSGFGFSPGCDANFSLTAMKLEDGSVLGRFSDQHGNSEGVIGVVDCLTVVDKMAWISGMATYHYPPGPYQAQPGDASGGGKLTFPFVVRVLDDGKDGDQLSGYYNAATSNTNSPAYGYHCGDMPDLPLYDAPQGTVKVK